MFKFNTKYAIIDSVDSMKSFIDYMNKARLYLNGLDFKAKVNVSQFEVENEDNYPVIFTLGAPNRSDTEGRHDIGWWEMYHVQKHDYDDNKNAPWGYLKIDHSEDKKLLKKCENSVYKYGDWIYEY